MENRLVTPHFQPIVNMETGATVGYEVLARSRMFGLESSVAMFSAAARLNMEVELSQMLRWEGIREALSFTFACKDFRQYTSLGTRTNRLDRHDASGSRTGASAPYYSGDP